MLFKRNRAMLQSIKADCARSREIIEITERIVTSEKAKPRAHEVATALTLLENTVAEHRQLIEENEKLVAKLERPIWKLF